MIVTFPPIVALPPIAAMPLIEALPVTAKFAPTPSAVVLRVVLVTHTTEFPSPFAAATD